MSNRIITIGREFGSGGRTIGREVAKKLGIPCYDQELIEKMAEESGFTPEYVEKESENASLGSWAASALGMDGTYTAPTNQDRLWAVQSRIIREIAEKESCVIVGRCADVILEAYHPLNIFVYADMAAKIARCQERAPEGENLTVKELERRIRQVEKGRRQFREMYSEIKWGEKEAYHLCINTSGREIKSLVPALVSFVECWFGPGEE